MNDEKRRAIESITEELDPDYDPNAPQKMPFTDTIIGGCGCLGILTVLALFLMAICSSYGECVVLIFVCVCWIIGIAKALCPNTR